MKWSHSHLPHDSYSRASSRSYRMGAHRGKAHVRLRQNELATHNRIMCTCAAHATAIPSTDNHTVRTKSARDKKHVASRPEIRTFGVVDEPHGGGGGPVLLDPERQPICETQQPHVKSGGAPTNQPQICAAAIQGPRQIGSPAARGARIGRLTFPERGGSIQLPLRHRGIRERGGE